MGGTNIKINKKLSAETIVNINNNVNNSDKIINQYIRLADLLFVVMAAANCIHDFNHNTFKRTFFSNIIFIAN